MEKKRRPSGTAFSSLSACGTTSFPIPSPGIRAILLAGLLVKDLDSVCVLMEFLGAEIGIRERNNMEGEMKQLKGGSDEETEAGSCRLQVKTRGNELALSQTNSQVDRLVVLSHFFSFKHAKLYILKCESEQKKKKKRHAHHLIGR